jgi:hypothetical protein
MASKYQFRCFKGTWGLWVELTAEAIPLSSASATAISISRQLWLQLKLPYIAHENLRFLIEGLKVVQAKIEERKKNGEPTLISVLEVKPAPSDFQPEALACAVVGWAAQEFGFSSPEIPITFDKQQNRYVVLLPNREYL